MPITKGCRQLVDEAMAQIKTCSVGEVQARLAHIDGGFAEWQKQGRPTESLEAHKARRHPKG